MMSFKATDFFELEIVAYYYIFTGIDFYSYSNLYNYSVRNSLLLKFNGTNGQINNK